MIKLETKAKTLSNLSKKKSKFLIPNFVSFNYDSWRKNKTKILKRLKKFKTNYIIARSSSYLEDNEKSSNAGKYLSINHIDIKNKKKKLLNLLNLFLSLSKKIEISS